MSFSQPSQIPEFSLYLKEDNQEKILSVRFMKSPLVFTLTEDDLTIIKTCHQAIFTDLLCLTPPFLTLDYFDATKDYLVAPVRVTRMTGGEVIEACVDMKLASVIANMATVSAKRPSLNEFKDAVVTVTHRQQQSSSGLPELFEVVSVDDSVTPRSPFPVPKYPSFADYYKSKYDRELSDLDQPGLKCKQLGLPHLKLFISRYEHQHIRGSSTLGGGGGGGGGEGEGEGGGGGGGETGKPASGSSHELVTFFPELTKIHPLQASFWKLLRCLPSLLWRMESLLLVDDLSQEIASQTGIGLLPNNSHLLTRTSLHGYQDAGFGDIPSQRVKVISSGDDAEIEVLGRTPREQLFQRGPDNGLLLQALTPRSANDSVNLERLESLGDSLLKLVSSLYLYINRPLAHGGKLSDARIRRISNVSLRLLAEKRGINKRILASDFNSGGESGKARLRWMPPCFKLQASFGEPVLLLKTEGGPSLPEHEVSYLYRRITDKCIADSVEALIGAHTVAGGLEGGLQLMKWLGVRIGEPAQQETETDVFSPSLFPHQQPTEPNILTLVSSQVFERHFGPLVLPREEDVQDNEELKKSLSTMIALTSRAQKKLNYYFKNHLLLIQAFTHLSYTRNRITGCYQRLEFLGDAILDYLVTCHIYSSDQFSTPQKMSEIRSAVVNNISFAKLTVHHNLHKHLLHNSPPLFKKVAQFAHALNAAESHESSLGGSSPLELMVGVCVCVCVSDCGIVHLLSFTRRAMPVTTVLSLRTLITCLRRRKRKGMKQRRTRRRKRKMMMSWRSWTLQRCWEMS